MSATGRGKQRQPYDFYRTPSWCVDAIVPFIGVSRRTLDPAAGDGSILQACAAHGDRFGHLEGYEIQSDLGDRIRSHGTAQVIIQDSLLAESWNRPDCVIMNPPYGHAQEFVSRALLEVQPHGGTVAALLRLNWLASRGRSQFHRENPSDVYVLSKRPSFSGGSTDATEYAWFVWGPKHGSRWFIL